MAHSMTGFGRGVQSTPEYNVTIDIKSVNHRYLDFYFKISKTYSYFEDKLRRVIAGKIARGKLDIMMNIERLATPEAKIELNRSMVQAYLTAIGEMKSTYQLRGEVDMQSVISLPEIFIISQPEEDQEKLGQSVLQALERALDAMLQMREAEGEQLVNDLKQKLAVLENYQATLCEIAPSIVVGYRDKLAKRIGELVGDMEVDPGRLAMEVAVFADRSDISEELTRLASHRRQFLKTLDLHEPIGRKLDFLIQEMNREINTIGSKANDLQISQVVINFKTELEKLREQIQNLE